MRRSTTLLAWGALSSPAAAWLEKSWQRAAQGWKPAASTGVPHPEVEQKFIEMGYSPRPTEAPELYGRMIFERADVNTLGSDTCGFNPNGNSFTCITGGATCAYSDGYVGCCGTGSSCSVVKTTCINYEASSAGACDLPEDFHTLCCGTASLGACFTWTYSTSGNVFSLLDCSATSGTSELLSYNPALGSPTTADASSTEESTTATGSDSAEATATDSAAATATDSSSSDSSSNSSSGSSSGKKKTPVGPIVGGVVGGVAAIAIIGALVFFFLRRRNNKNDKKDSTPSPQQPPVAQVQNNAPPAQSQSPPAQQPISQPPQSPQSYAPTTPSTHYPSGVPANFPQGYNQQGTPQPYDPRVSGYSQQGSPQPYPPQPGYAGGFVPQQQQQQQQYQSHYAHQKGYEQQGQFNQYGAVAGYQAPNASPPPHTTPSPAPHGNEAVAGGYQQQHSPPPQQNYQQTYQHHSNPSDAQELPAINPLGNENNRAELG